MKAGLHEHGAEHQATDPSPEHGGNLRRRTVTGVGEDEWGEVPVENKELAR